ncbi:hypothetical protein AVEN_28976-1 [Araneus ventricosus]|uniref:Retrovirus-related Pol polyprotein from transposon TNT 1-94-like beta-barrel domain-containing protein n=1 Tax=Araneus ventricosus TaxID=182803 RepID=A0A4Y2ALR4_ARAVE|nr:hypothetical protein AVEN_28976-1 [Araneus ventricosus]
MPECLVRFQLIRKMSVEYNLVKLLYRLEDKQFTFTNIETQLIIESGRIIQKKEDEGKETVTDAYVSKTMSQNRTSSIRRGTSLSQTKELKNGTSKRKYCIFCKRQGHEISNCYRRNPKLLSGLYHSQGTFYSDEQNHQKQYYTTTAPVNLNEWLVDSAATSHFCKEREWFEEWLKNLLPSDALIGEKHCKSKICGNIPFYVYCDGKFVKLILKNVLYAPNMRRNLISGAKIDIAGYKIIWHKNKMILYDSNGKYFITVPRVGNL